MITKNKFKLRVALDCDDVLYDCNNFAVKMLNTQKGCNYSIQDIYKWGKLGGLLDKRLDFFQEETFYRDVPLMDGASEFVSWLSQRAEVVIITSTPPQCIGARMKRLIEDFPQIPVDNIFFGSRKNMLHVDMILDDGFHNLIDSKANYPVLYRRPWNNHISGTLAVNNYEECKTLIETILEQYNERTIEPRVICLVGPSGSGKTTVMKELVKDPRFQRVPTWTTRDPRPDDMPGAYHHTSKEEFLSSVFFESTVYGGEYYGTKLAEVEDVMKDAVAVLAMDISGCMAMKRHFGEKCALVFCKRDKEAMLDSILSRDVPVEVTKKRLLSMDGELRNEEFCDCVIDNNGSVAMAAAQIKKIVQ